MKPTNRSTRHAVADNSNATDSEPISTPELDHILRVADTSGNIGHQEISNLTKLILKIKPEQMDQTLLSRLAEIRHRVKAQQA